MKCNQVTDIILREELGSPSTNFKSTLRTFRTLKVRNFYLQNSQVSQVSQPLIEGAVQGWNASMNGVCAFVPSCSMRFSAFLAADC